MSERTEEGFNNPGPYKTLRGRKALASIFDPVGEEEGTGSDGYTAAGVEEYVLKLLVRTVPVVKSLGHWTRNVPSNPEQNDDPDEPLLHISIYIAKYKDESN